MSIYEEKFNELRPKKQLELIYEMGKIIMRGTSESMKKLITANINIYIQGSILQRAIVIKDLDLIKYLFEYPKIIINGESKIDALSTAAQLGSFDIVKYLISQGANVRGKDDVSLKHAAAGGYLDIIKYFVDLGGDITSENNGALYLAAGNAHLEMVDYLLDNGAKYDANKINIMQKETINKALDYQKQRKLNTQKALEEINMINDLSKLILDYI